MDIWAVSNMIVSFHLASKFPLNHDYGRKGSHQLSNENHPGCSGYIGDYTTQLYEE